MSFTRNFSRRKSTKIGSKPTSSTKKFQGLKTKNGKTTKNPFETSTYVKLSEKVTTEYESTRLPYTTEHVYVPDFIVRPTGKESFIVETKGNGRSWTPQVRAKMLAVKRQHPDLDVRFLFYSDGQFGSKRKDGSRQSQSEWATKHGFQYAIRDVPEDWLI